MQKIPKRIRLRVDRHRLQAMMAIRGFTNETLASATDRHYNSILRLKQEQSTTFNHLESLCETLHCHPFDLIVAEGFPDPFLGVPGKPLILRPESHSPWPDEQ